MVFFYSMLEKLFLISRRSLNRLSRPLQDTKTQKLSLNFRGLQPHCAKKPLRDNKEPYPKEPYGIIQNPNEPNRTQRNYKIPKEPYKPLRNHMKPPKNLTEP